ncbi:MAG: tetratricopeptide repeat protein [Planctomycetota bacterium]
MIDRRSLRQWGLAGLLVVAGLVAYSNAIGGAFVFDDLRSIVDRADALNGPLGPLLAGDRRPLVTLTLAANHRLGGLDPRGYHAFNIAVHIATALALFTLVRHATTRVGRPADATALAFAATLLWVVHPLGTASVTYVIQRAEAMAALSMLVMLLAVLAAARAARPVGWAVAAALAAALGILSKPTMIVAPLMAVLFDGLVASGSFREALTRRWAMHAAIAASCLLIVPTGLAAALLQTTPDAETGAGLAVTTVAPLEYLRSQPGVILHYLGLALRPATLCIDPDWPVAGAGRELIIPVTLVLAGLAATLLAVRRRHPLAFPAAAFFLMLAPTSSVVPIRDLAAEHRMYLPLAAVILIVVAALLRGLRAAPDRVAIPLGIGLLALATTGLAARTIDRNRDYATPVTLWTATVEAAPHNHRARMNLGVALRDAGRNDEAVAVLATALDMQSNDPIAQLNLGAALLDEGRLDEATEMLRIAATRLRDRPRAWILLGDAHRTAGRMDEALSAYRRAVAVQPDPAIRLRLGNALADAGRLDEAAAEFETAAGTTDDDRLRASAMFNLGNTRYRQQDFPRAAAAYEAALAADPDHDAARHWLAEARRRGPAA